MQFGTPVEKLLHSTAERYNLIMEFLEETCSSASQKQLCCLIIAKLIPEMERVSFADIEQMLKVVK